jgi:aqualysin 1
MYVLGCGTGGLRRDCPRSSPHLLPVLLRLVIAGALTVATLSLPAAAHAEPRTPKPAPLIEAASHGIPDQYIVVLKEWADPARFLRGAAAARAVLEGVRIRYKYQSALPGFSARLDPEQLEAVRQAPGVAYVEADTVVDLNTDQANADWGLDRIDQRNLPRDGIYRYSRTAGGVTAFVIDSGIRATHREFGGRVTGGFSAIGDGRGTDDCNGHGTHVAGILGGRTFGVAKNVSLVPVRVFACGNTGTTSAVLAGVDWVTRNRAPRSVANMSLGGPVSQALDDAVNRSIASGISYAVAAGNEGWDACTGSPAVVAAAVTVAASNTADARPTWSNFGRCVDLFAPGDSVTSAGISSDTATRMMSGTSMATPLVTGTAALLLEDQPWATPATIHDALLHAATADVLTGIGSGSPNRLLYGALSAATLGPEWFGAEDVHLQGDFLNLGFQQTLAVNPDGRGGRIGIFDLARPTIVDGVSVGTEMHRENWGGPSTVDGWDGPEDRLYAGDYLALGYDQLLAINGDPQRRGGRLAVFDFTKPVSVGGAKVATIRYWESFGQNPALDGWTDPNDYQIVGDFQRLGYDQLLLGNRDGGGGRLMLINIKKAAPFFAVDWWENWGGPSTVDGWDGSEDRLYAGDVRRLGHDQLLTINRDPLRRGGRMAAHDFSQRVPIAGTQVARVRHWESFWR